MYVCGNVLIHSNLLVFILCMLLVKLIWHVFHSFWILFYSKLRRLTQSSVPFERQTVVQHPLSLSVSWGRGYGKVPRREASLCWHSRWDWHGCLYICDVFFHTYEHTCINVEEWNCISDRCIIPWCIMLFKYMLIYIIQNI